MSYKLYRGVSREKYNNDYEVIKSYKIGSFCKNFSLDEGHKLDEWLTLDSSKENAVILHQEFPSLHIKKELNIMQQTIIAKMG